MEGGRKIA